MDGVQSERQLTMSSIIIFTVKIVRRVFNVERVPCNYWRPLEIEKCTQWTTYMYVYMSCDYFPRCLFFESKQRCWSVHF